MMQSFVDNLKTAVEKNSHFTIKPGVTKTELRIKFFRYGNLVASKEHVAVLTFPVLEEDGSITSSSGVSRACGTFLFGGRELSLYEVFFKMLTDSPAKLFSDLPKMPLLKQAINGIVYNNMPLTFRTVQRHIDFVVNKLPLTGTPYEKWAMSNRVMILDPSFDGLAPYDKLEYQKEVNRKMFPWTSLGLSDSGMCNNDLLKIDLRDTVPYARRFHNPQRNLYQTLGMKGDELPLVRTQTEKDMMSQGIERRGWNLTTAFLDLPWNFEDQIILNKRLKNLKIKEVRRFVSWGQPVVTEGDEMRMLYPVSIEPTGEIIRFSSPAEKAYVSKIYKRKVTSSGLQSTVTIIEITLERNFKDGFKITNRHGNKGIVWLTETGYMKTPTGQKAPIDVIVSATSVRKRKNFGQLFEALTTLVNGDKVITLSDQQNINSDKLREALVSRGYNPDGTNYIETPWGDFKAVCGKVFWGVLKTPEDQVWKSRDVQKTDNKGLRTSGIKISHIEMKALTTILGPKNPVVSEILSHQQGDKHLVELITTVMSLKGVFPKSAKIISARHVPMIDQRAGFLHDEEDLEGTILDSYPDGFVLKLPVHIDLTLDRKRNQMSYKISKSETDSVSENKITLDKIYIPSSETLATWRHPSGKIGMETAASIVNSLVGFCKGWEDQANGTAQILSAFRLYVEKVTKSLSTKVGKMSNLGMSVRYPNSVKATAMLGCGLPENTIQIHEKMAKDLKVKEGGTVLAERYPCLGFMSVRPQMVTITKDESCRYVIKVSGNSLNSLNLDFDGDVLFLMSFESPEARSAVRKALEEPHPKILAATDKARDKKVPKTEELALGDYGIERFVELTPERNAEIVAGLTGIKRGTGSIVALCYNLMRIIEGRVPYSDKDTSIGMECLLDVVANSVFSRKHAGKSLEKECREAIATANLEKMLALGLDSSASEKLCSILRDEAKQLGVKNLDEDFRKAEETGGSIVINRIVRRKHKIWFASRSNLPGPILAEHLKAKPADLASHMLKRYLKSHSKLAALGV